MFFLPDGKGIDSKLKVFIGLQSVSRTRSSFESLDQIDSHSGFGLSFTGEGRFDILLEPKNQIIFFEFYRFQKNFPNFAKLR